MDKYKLAYEMRQQKKTYIEIGKLLGITHSYARKLVLHYSLIKNRESRWTDGLSPRVANAIRYAGFNSKEEIIKAFQNNPERLNECVGLGKRGLYILKKWLGLTDMHA